MLQPINLAVKAAKRFSASNRITLNHLSAFQPGGLDADDLK
jgi:hypothetical protein